MTAPVLGDDARAALARNDRYPLNQADGLIGVAPPGLLSGDEETGRSFRRTVDQLVLRFLVLPFLRFNERLIRWRCPPGAIIDRDSLPVIAKLESHWPEIRAEVDELLAGADPVPRISTFVPDLVHAEDVITERGGSWHGFAIIDPKGWWIDFNAQRCPRTSAVLRSIPEVQTAIFSVLTPHTVLPTHQGANKGQLTVHLAVVVPDPPGSGALQAGDEVVTFEEGVAFSFDDTNTHTAWNEGDGPRVSLIIQVPRPVPWPASWTNPIAQRLFPLYSYPRGGWGRLIEAAGEAPRAAPE